MGVLREKRFWFGVIVGVAGYYLYLNHIKGKGGNQGGFGK